MVSMGLEGLIDPERLVVVAPNAVAGQWNDGRLLAATLTWEADDVAFIRGLIGHLVDTGVSDPHRVYVTGFSNGGMMAYRLANELSDRIAAIAPVAGVTGVPTCTPSRPMPVIHFHGTADTLVPYNGSSTLGFIPVPDSFAQWAARDACTGDPVETFRNGDSHCSTYQQCAGGADVTLCTVDNGGHTWPGGTPVPTLGVTTTDLSATDAMWTFFEAHPLR